VYERSARNVTAGVLWDCGRGTCCVLRTKGYTRLLLWIATISNQFYCRFRANYFIPAHCRHRETWMRAEPPAHAPGYPRLGRLRRSVAEA
jgi:hypothetical protein